MAIKGFRPDEMVEVDGVLYRPDEVPDKRRDLAPTRTANTGGSGSSEGTAPVADVATTEEKPRRSTRRSSDS